MKKIIAGLMILVLSIMISGCGVPGPWEEVGFTGNEPGSVSWEKWEQAGFTPEEVKVFKPILELIKEQTNIYSSEYITLANGFKKLNLPLKEIHQWVKAGFYKPEQIKGWRTISEDPKIAIQWEENTYFPGAKKMAATGYSIDKLLSWAKAVELNLRWEGAVEIIEGYKDAGYSIDELLSWAEVVKFNRGGENAIKIIEEYKKANLSLNDVKAMKNLGLSADILLELKKINISPKRYIEVKKAGEFDGWRNDEKIIAWAKTDANSEVIKKYKNLDLMYLNVKNLNNILRYCSKIENGDLSYKTPFVTKDKCFDYYGKVTKIRSQKSVEIEECVKTDNQFDDCMGGRVSILNFEKSIPDTMTSGSKYRGIVLGGGNIEEFLLGNSSENTEVIFPVLED